MLVGETWWQVYKECYCQFDDSMCDFDKFRSGGEWFTNHPNGGNNINNDETGGMKAKDFNNFNTAAIEVNPNNPRS